jgi:glutathione peroxidase
VKYIGIVGLVTIALLFSNRLFSKGETKETEALPSNLYNINILGNNDKPINLGEYKGKLVLFVNVASNCGFTSQYESLELLYQKYKDKGFLIIGMPSNDFGGQEPGNNVEIASFCKLNYGVTFPLTTKLKIKGKEQHPLIHYLLTSNPNYSGSVKWNFSKFLVDKTGHVVNRFSSMTKPLSSSITEEIEMYLSN